MTHFIKLCKFCGDVIAQCRCINANKDKIYGVCNKCVIKQIVEPDKKLEDTKEVVNGN
jgi:hypothetical protein